jgi:sodium/hydrogen antiporter
MAIHYTIMYIGAVAIVFALVSRKLAHSPLTGPMYFTAAGLLGAWIGVWDPALEPIDTSVVLELTLALVLFTEAMKLRLRSWTEDFELPTRLLAIGMPLTILLGAVLAAVMLPGVGLLTGAIVATVLAPTDAALGLAVVENPKVPTRIREALSVESGLNDGIALPVLVFFVALAETEEGAALGPLFFEAVGVALAVGVVIAVVAGAAMHFATERGWMEQRWQQLSIVVVALITFAVSDELGGSGFIAAFVGGLVFGRVIRVMMTSEVAEFADDLGTALTMFSFMLFGGVILYQHREFLSVAALVYAVVSLTVVRMAPVAISMIGAGLDRKTIAFMGWFGPRGLASIIFAGVVVEEADIIDSNLVVAVMAVTVTASIFLHGATAYYGAESYGGSYESAATSSPS